MTDQRNDDAVGQLISRVALGDRKAFSDLYGRTGPKLFGVCLRILRQQAQAEDALQEIYVKIWQRSQSFSAGQAAPMAWLVTIARNHCIDMLRARRPDPVELDDAPFVADEAPDPEAVAVNTSEGRRIDNCLGQLDADRAQAVVSAYVEGYSYQELAGQYSVPLNTMRTWLRRSLISLKECMER
ncbi:sigma-70 family RNA polymerase sigma factor [Pseudohoeflea coraliihabitans]|uniref:Sigma-70 family RNA polymerase sigma factor n=1 Tax=Pseudohoeflea coraliihabitans TaxID=2860393 RepID=A0ABS6WN79_9HYPH|nr:sigma-70 family RNA polymerase sigma factor [Pseudohoeflea sp. DP4N28-3]MBW3096867.1 sigma-70 family RNA polymerase sigma factor [Pseudohoeflea sp. DP4N28-3]